MNDVSKFLTTAETGELTHLPLSTLAYFRYSGTGPSWFKLGRRVMYERAAVVAWIAAQQAAALELLNRRSA